MWIIIFEIVFIYSLLVIFYQDIAERLVSWWLFPLMGISGLIIRYLHSNVLFWEYLLVSVVMIVFLFSSMYLYLRIIKKIEFKNIESQIGFGDILFIIAWVFSYSPMVFIKLFIVVLILTLLVHKLVILRFQKNSNVPLAGLSAIFLVMVEVIGYFGVIELR